jgi:hypothetical protein
MRSRANTHLASWGCENESIWSEGTLISPGLMEKVQWLPRDFQFSALGVHSRQQITKTPSSCSVIVAKHIL